MPKSWMTCCMVLISIGHLVGNVLITSGQIYMSRHNYPGGVAMHKLHELEMHSMSCKYGFVFCLYVKLKIFN